MTHASSPASRILRGVACTLTLTIAAAFTATASAQTCTKEQVAEAVDRAGAALRAISAETSPRVDAKMRQLRDARGWASNEFEERALATIQDERVGRLDATANELLARIDTLGGTDGKPVECSRITEIDATSLELQATLKAKAAYVVSRLDAAIAEGKGAATTAQPKSAPEMKTAVASPPTSPPAAPPAASAAAPKAPSAWSTAVKEAPKSAPQPSTAAPTPLQPAQQASVAPLPTPTETAPLQPPAVPATGSDGYSIDEIVAASRGVFGKVSANLGAVLEHAFATSGRPTGYILGDESGGAFVAGLRYGKGTLYLRTGQQVPIYWHGPSVGADFGASGAKVLFLVYKLADPEDLHTVFTGVEGSAYVVGGLGLTFLSNGKIQMAPIRSGLGLRIGANVGYTRFTPRPTWNPF